MPEVWKEVTVSWKGEYRFAAVNGAGGSVEMASGLDSEFLTPMELVLAALAGCTAVDVVSILGKKRVALDDFKVRVKAKRANDHPKVYTECHLEYLFWGNNIKEKDVEQAISLSEEKYCSVSAMLKPQTTIKYTYQILEPGTPVD